MSVIGAGTLAADDFMVYCQCGFSCFVCIAHVSLRQLALLQQLCGTLTGSCLTAPMVQLLRRTYLLGLQATHTTAAVCLMDSDMQYAAVSLSMWVLFTTRLVVCTVARKCLASKQQQRHSPISWGLHPAIPGMPSSPAGPIGPIGPSCPGYPTHEHISVVVLCSLMIVVE